MHRRTISIVSASVMFAAAAIVSAVPSHAADAGTITVSGGLASPTALAGVAGDTFTIENANGGRLILLDGTGSFRKTTTFCSTPQSPCSMFDNTPNTFTVVGEGSALLYEWNGTSLGALVTTIFINSSGSDPNSSATSVNTPAPIIQQFGRPIAGTCDAVAPLSLNWSGVASGGWGETWGEWMNDGKGGAVCSRTLVYSTNQAKWTVG